jgi:hypothetical protein
VPPGVPVARYRADHSHCIDIIDQLERPSLFLERDRDSKKYIVRVYGLPLVEDAHARALLKQMEEAFQLFKAEYRKRLNEPTALSDIIAALDMDFDKAAEMLSYMVQSHDIWCGLSNDFPVEESSSICISEQVLRHESFGEILSQFYEWHIINPHKSAEALLPNLEENRFTSDGFFTLADLTPRPKWYDELDDVKKALIGEIDKAVKQNLSALPTIGLRTLLEMTMLEQIPDQNSFAKNIEKFQEAGYVTKLNAKLLEKVVNAGNASAHRAYFPNKEDLCTCIEVLKHLLHGMYVLKPKVDKVAKNTPERDRKKSPKGT